VNDPVVVGGVAAAVVVLIGLALVIWLWRRNRSSIRDAIAAIAVEHKKDILVPDGMGGEIHCEHLLLTRHGILVINVKQYDGIIFASDRMDQWTAIGSGGRSTFRNPLPNLYDRVAAVRQLVRDVDVRGYALFPATADFSKGRPDDVILPETLLAGYEKPDKAELGRVTEAFGPHWERVREAARPASG
jgi:hypothetical protein